MEFTTLNSNNIYTIPVGEYFDKDCESCFIVYSPLANIFYLSLPGDVMKLEEAIKNGQSTDLLNTIF